MKVDTAPKFIDWANSNYVILSATAKEVGAFLMIVTPRWQDIAGNLVIRDVFEDMETRCDICENYGIVVSCLKRRTLR